MVELIAKGYKFYMVLNGEIFGNLLVAKFKNYAYQFPSIVMSGMKGFHVSASGAIQGHHGPLVGEPTCSDQDIVFRKSLQSMFVCACVHLCICQSRFSLP